MYPFYYENNEINLEIMTSVRKPFWDFVLHQPFKNFPCESLIRIISTKYLDLIRTVQSEWVKHVHKLKINILVKSPFG